jgi:broad specificity phosphatase PhoE
MHQQRRCFAMMAGRSTRYAQSQFCGWTDTPLAAEGRQAVLALRETFQRDGIELPKIWYVSDRRRAVATFEIMSAAMHAPVVRLSAALREINFGHYETLTWDELPADFQSHYEYSLSRPSELRFPGGESFGDFCDRVTRGLLQILAEDKDDSNIGIIGHQGSMRIFFMVANGIKLDAFFDDTPQPGSGDWISISLADVEAWRSEHLREFLDV